MAKRRSNRRGSLSGAAMSQSRLTDSFRQSKPGAKAPKKLDNKVCHIDSNKDADLEMHTQNTVETEDTEKLKTEVVNSTESSVEKDGDDGKEPDYKRAKHGSNHFDKPEKRQKLDVNSEVYRQAALDILSGRLTGQIHCEGMSNADTILREFDLTAKYGPCAGMTRLERWNRADALGQSPPTIVKAICMTAEGLKYDNYRESIWHGSI